MIEVIKIVGHAFYFGGFIDLVIFLSLLSSHVVYCMPQTVWTFNLRPKRLKTIGQNFLCLQILNLDWTTL